MTEGGESFFSPEPPVPPLPIFADGYVVHVFEGTDVGEKGFRNVGWLGKVVGREGDSYGAEPAACSERTSQPSGREVYESSSRFWVRMFEWRKGAL